MMDFAGQTRREIHLNPRLSKSAGIALLCFAQTAFASAPDCAVDPSSQLCKLQHTLHTLYWVAGILGVLLLIISVLAYLSYRKNMSKALTPDD